jgi:hypothetical protein
MRSDLKHGFELCPPDRPTLNNQCDYKEKVPCKMSEPPTREDLEKEAEQRRKTCDFPFKPDLQKPVDLPKPCDPPPPSIGAKAADEGKAQFDANRGVQRGAQ